MPNEILKEIFELVLAINEEGKYQVFLNLSPHVSLIDLRIIKGQWISGATSMSNGLGVYYNEDWNGLEEMRDKLYQIYGEEI